MTRQITTYRMSITPFPGNKRFTHIHTQSTWNKPPTISPVNRCHIQRAEIRSYDPRPRYHVSVTDIRLNCGVCKVTIIWYSYFRNLFVKFWVSFKQVAVLCHMTVRHSTDWRVCISGLGCLPRISLFCSLLMPSKNCSLDVVSLRYQGIISDNCFFMSMCS